LRPAHADAGKPGGRLVQRLQRQVDPGRDHAPQVGTRLVHDVERCCSAEVDHDQRPAKIPVPGQRIQQAVRADLVRVVDLDLEAPVQ
jgi:hypothetical protein